MIDAGGDIFKVSNQELHKWQDIFLESEGIDIYSAAAVAVASLAQAVETGVVGKDEMIMLNITGGGEKLAWKEHEICHSKPALILDPADDENVIISKVEALFK